MTSVQWVRMIEDACAEPDPAQSNRQITVLHYQLSEALADAMARACGPNFHSWAVWGSRKAGFTIRKEDLDSAIHNATVTAGIVGALVGAVTGLAVGRQLQWHPDFLTAFVGAGAGTLAGGWTGSEIAIRSREKAAQLMLQGNRIVIREIGEQSARFLELLQSGADDGARKLFFAGFRRGATEDGGQERLVAAFSSYLEAVDATAQDVREAAMVAGNCAIVYHEHIRLEPYIRSAMPWIVRRCATQRFMTYEVGDRVLTVGENLPGVSSPTAARNWVKIEERMHYVFSLFKEFHHAPEVFSKPYPNM